MSWRHWNLDRRRWARTRQAVLDRDNFRCVTCGRAGVMECDHVTPLWADPQQNPYDPDGCQTLCRRCHFDKSRDERARRPTADELAWQELVDELR